MNELIKHIQEKWKCTPERYPELEGANQEEYLRFVLRHSALHFAKTSGKIASASEDFDHGASIETCDLRRQVAKSLINTLHLASELGMDEDELFKMVKDIVK